MATYSPSSVSAPAEGYSGYGAYIKFEITGLRQSNGATNQTYVDWKITVNSTTPNAYTYLAAAYVELKGGKTGTIVLLNGIPSGSWYKTSWTSGTALASGTSTFNNNDNGSITLTCNIKQQFYYAYNSTNWNNGTYAQTKSQNITVSTIPRGFTSTPTLTLKSRTETQIVYNWSTSEICSAISVSGTGTKSTTGLNSKSGTITITGLSAGTSYTHTGTFTRKDTGVTGTKAATNSTYAYPAMTSMPNFTIGNKLTLTLSNPRGLSCRVYIIGADGSQISDDTTTGTSISGYNGDTIVNNLYNSIPNSPSGTYKVRLVCSSLNRDTTVNGGTYTINYDVSKPTFSNFVYEDSNTTTLALTGNNQKIIKGYSTLKVIISGNNKAVGYKGATISKYKINGTAYNYNDTFVQEVANYDVNPLKVAAVDSRNNEQAAPDFNFGNNWIDYFKPTKQNFSYERANQGVGEQVTFNLSGTFFNQNFGQQNNTLTATYRFKKTNESQWTTGSSSISLTTNNNNYSFSGILLGNSSNNGFDVDSSYNVEIIVSDQLSSTTFTYLIIEGSPAIDLYGNCISLGGMYNESRGGRVQINSDLSLIGNFTMNGSPIIEYADTPSNGQYIKFADGTMICIGILQMANKNTQYHYQSRYWGFPAPFISKPKVVANVDNWSTYAAFTKVHATNNGAGCNIMVHIMATSTSSFVDLDELYLVNAIAIGRWK